MGEGVTLAEVLDRLEDLFDGEGLDALAELGRLGGHPGKLARPRRHELVGAINRLRTLRAQLRR